MSQVYTFKESPDHDAFAALCTPDRRIKAVIGISLDHVITNPLIDIASAILCPVTPGLEKAKFRPVGAGSGTSIAMLPVGLGWSSKDLGEVILLEVDADADDVLTFYGLEPGAAAVPQKLERPVLRLVDSDTDG